jgi:hypothetical protein
MSYDDALLHWPPRESPDYERERDDFSVANLEWQMDKLAAEANELHALAYRAYDAGDLDTADGLIDAGDRKWNEWNRIKRELSDFENGW